MKGIELNKTYFINHKNNFELIRNVKDNNDDGMIRVNGIYYNRQDIRLFNKVDGYFKEREV